MPATKNSKFRQLLDVIKSTSSGSERGPLLLPEGETTRSESAKSVSTSLRILQFIPWILSAVFILSFYFDFEGYSGGLSGFSLEFEGILRILSISGLIGFLTNWIAITMLFRPRNPRPILGHGLIPSQKDIIAEKLSNTVNKNLINPLQIREKLVQSQVLSKLIGELENKLSDLTENKLFREQIYTIATSSLKEYLENPEVREEITNTLLLHLENALDDKSLEKIAFKVYKNLRKEQLKGMIDRALLQLPDTVYQKRHQFDDFIEAIPSGIVENREEIEEFLINGVYDILHRVDLRAIIKQNLDNYDEGRLENLIKESTLEQLNYIKYLGAILGVFGGLIIWNPILALSGLLLTGIIIFGLDALLPQKSEE